MATITDAHGKVRMNNQQVLALVRVCRNYGVLFREADFLIYPETSSMMAGWAEGWIGDRIQVGCSPEGDVHS